MQKCHYGRCAILFTISAACLFFGFSTAYASDATGKKLLEYELGKSIDELESIIPVVEKEKAIDIAMPFFNLYPSFTEGLLGNAIIYLPVIEKILAQYQLPDDLKYLPLFESSFRIDAVSRAGAKGLWQFMEGTARKYGLTVNAELDERMDYIKSTEAAARFLKDLYEQFGDWALVLMAYNGGPYRIKRIIDEHRTHDVKTIMRYMPQESRTYLSKMIAAKLIFHNYEYYDLHPRIPVAEDLYHTHLIFSSRIDTREISRDHDISYALLMASNPHLRQRVVQNKGQVPINIRIPAFAGDTKIHFRDVSLFLRDEKKLAALAQRINWEVRKIEMYNGHYNQFQVRDHLYTIPVPEKDYLSIIREFGPPPLSFLTQKDQLQHLILDSKRAFVKYELSVDSPDGKIYYLSPMETLVEVAQKLNISIEAIKDLNPDINLYQSAKIFVPNQKDEEWPLAMDTNINNDKAYIRYNTGHRQTE